MALPGSRSAFAPWSIPARYVHIVNETASIHDAHHAITFLARYLVEAHTRDPGATV